MTNEDYIEVKALIKRRRELTVAYNSADGLKIPSIRFSGSYLEDLGYPVGSKYELVINQDNSFTIRPCESEPVTAPLVSSGNDTVAPPVGHTVPTNT